MTKAAKEALAYRLFLVELGQILGVSTDYDMVLLDDIRKAVLKLKEEAKK